MLPKFIVTPTPLVLKKENIASCLIIEDHLKLMLSQTKNSSYRPWNNKFAPKYPHSCFGDFSKELLLGKKKPILATKLPNFEESHASTVFSIKKYFLILLRIIR